MSPVEVDPVREAQLARQQLRRATRAHRRAFRGIVPIRGIYMLADITVPPAAAVDDPQKRRRRRQTPKPGQRRAAWRRS